MEEKFKYIFSNVNEWLKFAEAKLAGLIVFNGAILIGIMQICKELNTLNWHLKNAITVQIFSNIFSLIISLFGLNPSIRRKKISKSGIKENDNLLFWGDIQKYDQDSFIKKFKSDFNIEMKINLYEKQILDQIIQNSKLTKRKSILFKLSLIITIIGLVISLIILI